MEPFRAMSVAWRRSCLQKIAITVKNGRLLKKPFVRRLPQKTTATTANAQAAAVPAPSAAAEEVTANQVDPERAKQLTQAVAEQVRTAS